MEKPSQRIMQALEGRRPICDLDNAELSAIRFPIYLQACVVLNVADNKKRASYLDKLAPEVREMLKKECRRIYDLRRGKQ